MIDVPIMVEGHLGKGGNLTVHLSTVSEKKLLTNPWQQFTGGQVDNTCTANAGFCQH